jgi:hypothetical protein
MSITPQSEPTSGLIGVSHEDGDLVLATGEREDHIEETFCVHRAIICLHSAALRDLVENARQDEYMDGRPVVRCYDSASDIRALLCALYNGLYVPLPL